MDCTLVAPRVGSGPAPDPPRAGPTVMALLRDTAASLLHRADCRACASRLRAHADEPLAAVARVVGPNHTRAAALQQP